MYTSKYNQYYQYRMDQCSAMTTDTEIQLHSPTALCSTAVGIPKQPRFMILMFLIPRCQSSWATRSVSLLFPHQ